MTLHQATNSPDSDEMELILKVESCKEFFLFFLISNFFLFFNFFNFLFFNFFL